MAGLLDTVQRFRKLETATAPSDDPAPVYLLDEIADMARQSPEGAQAIADAVQKKLQVKSPVVKFKALRIIKHLCTKGCSQFQRCMQRHSSAVRELIHWRGEPDPFKGDVPNARVREFAKEVVEVMFNATPASNNTTNTLAAQGKIQGFGSGGQDAGSSSGPYGGIGSSSSGTGGYGGGFRSSGAAAGSGGFAAAQSAASQLGQAAQQALGEGPIAAGLASAASALGGLLQPGGYGSKLNDGGYRDAGASDYGYSSASSYSAPEVAAVSASQVLGSEASLVDDITTPSGLRPLPDPRDLARFVDAAGSLDGLRLAELLREKMESPRWQVVLRALAALEAVLQRGSSRGCGEVAVMFQSEPSAVRRGLSSPQPQVQQVAAVVLKLLTGEEVQVPAAAPGKKGPAAAAAKAAPVADLLIDDGPAEAAPAAAAAAGGGGGAAAGIDLLGDLSGPSPAPPAAAAAAAGGVDSLFDGLGVAAAPAATSNGAGDLFGGLEVAAPAAAAPAPAPVPKQHQQQPVPAAAPLDELFSGLSTTSAGPTSSSSSSSLMQPAAQQQQQRPALPDLLGDLASSPVRQQPVGLGGMPQANGLQQQQQQFGMGLQPGLGMQQQQQWVGGGLQQQPLGASKPGGFGGPSPAAAAAAGQHHGTPGMPALCGGSGGSGAWAGHDDVSNLMRHVSHGGKYDPAFDFVSQEFKKK